MLLMLAALLLAAAPEPASTPITRRLTAQEGRFVDTGNRLAGLYAEYARQFAAGVRDVRLERKLAKALRDFERLLLPAEPDDSRTAVLCPAK